LQTQDELNDVHHILEPTDETTMHHWANVIVDPDTGASMEYQHLSKSPKHQQAWIQSFANELGCLAQGIGGCKTGTNTVYFIPHDKVPPDRQCDVTYVQICVNYCPHKTEPNCTRLTMGGGDLINYPSDVSTPTADTTTAKSIINSMISTPTTWCMV
jgi:hypothetical protein